MKILTIATQPEGYFPILQSTAENLGYSLTPLGWQQPWQGFGWKLKLFADALAQLPESEPVVCVDGYDVVVLGPAAETAEKFRQMNAPIVFSGQRYFPTHKWIRRLADKLMSNDKQQTIGASDKVHDYSRPCLGLFMGYAGALTDLFRQLLAIEAVENTRNDQVLLNIHYLRNPNAIVLDDTCDIFQNLWRTNSGLYGSISPKSPACEVEVVQAGGLHRLRNKAFGTLPCFMHGPFNLDMSPLLKELRLPAWKPGLKKGWRYWNYSLMHHFGRGISFFRKEIGIILLAVLLAVVVLLLLS